MCSAATSNLRLFPACRAGSAGCALGELSSRLSHGYVALGQALLAPDQTSDPAAASLRDAALQAPFLQPLPALQSVQERRGAGQGQALLLEQDRLPCCHSDHRLLMTSAISLRTLQTSLALLLFLPLLFIY